MIKQQMISATAHCDFSKNVDKDDAWTILSKAFTDGVKENKTEQEDMPLMLVRADGIRRIEKSEDDPISAGDIFEYKQPQIGDTYIQLTDWNPGKSFAFNNIKNSPYHSTKDMDIETTKIIAQMKVTLNERGGLQSVIIHNDIDKETCMKKTLAGDFNTYAQVQLMSILATEAGQTSCFDSVTINADDSENTLEF